jgi:hypothetical protein
VSVGSHQDRAVRVEPARRRERVSRVEQIAAPDLQHPNVHVDVCRGRGGAPLVSLGPGEHGEPGPEEVTMAERALLVDDAS